MLFGFGDVIVKSQVMIEVALEAPRGLLNIMVLVDIVPFNLPALLGLSVLDAESLYADNATDRLVHRRIISRSSDTLYFVDIWSVPIVRHERYLYAKMSLPSTTFYTTAKLSKLHQQFPHPSALKLYNLLCRGGLEAVGKDTLERMNQIFARCEPCQRIRNAPFRFRVTMGHEDVRFNARVFMDIVYLDGRPVLHLVDEINRFSATRFLSKMTTEGVSDAIVMFWPQYARDCQIPW